MGEGVGAVSGVSVCVVGGEELVVRVIAVVVVATGVGVGVETGVGFDFGAGDGATAIVVAAASSFVDVDACPGTLRLYPLVGFVFRAI